MSWLLFSNFTKKIFLVGHYTKLVGHVPHLAPPWLRHWADACKGHYTWFPYIYVDIIHSVAIAGSKIIAHANV